MKLSKNNGIVFWVTGLSGAGKTELSKKILKMIEKRFGPTLLVSGDDLRDIFKLTGYEKRDRYQIAKMYSNFSKFISNQKINLILAVGALFNKIHTDNRKSIKNYIEIYIKTEIKTLKKYKKKKIYKQITKNIWGIDLKPEFPKKPDVTIVNNYRKNLNHLSKDLIKKIINLKKIKKYLING